MNAMRSFRTVYAVEERQVRTELLSQAEAWARRSDAELALCSNAEVMAGPRTWARSMNEDDLIILPHPKLGALAARTASLVLQSTRASVLLAGLQPSSGNILAATDLSDPRFPALEAAWRTARETGRKLTTLHCAQAAPSPDSICIPISAFDLGAVYFPMIENRPLQALQNALDRVGIDDASARISLLPPAVGIEATVREVQAELLVMGSHRRGWLYRRLFGSTCESVLGRVTCSILVVRLGAG